MGNESRFVIKVEDYPSDEIQTMQISCAARSDDFQSSIFKNKSVNLVLDPSTPKETQNEIRDLLENYLFKITTSHLR